MAMLDVYVGYLDDPDFNFDGGNWNGNIPKRESDFFPLGHRDFSELIKRIKNGDYVGKQVDWGAWVAILSKEEIIDFIDYQYSSERLGYIKDFLTSIESRLDRIKEFVADLDEDKKYALVACEF